MERARTKGPLEGGAAVWIRFLAVCLLILLAPSAFSLEIEVSYGSGFDDPVFGADRRKAFEAAVGVWEQVVEGSVKVRVAISFESLGGDGGSAVLGSAGPSTVHRDFLGAPLDNTWYVGALANQLSGSDLDTQSNDMRARFNADVDGDYVLGTRHWYYGTDGKPPGNDIDFVTTALHELGHGLGFLTLIGRNGGWLTAGGRASPDIFGLQLTYRGVGDLSDLGRSNRADALTSGNLFWKGPQVVAEHGAEAKMYAPSTYRSGSSVSHWDRSHSPDLLMEPYNTGPKKGVDLTREALLDLGWSIFVEPPPGPEPNPVPSIGGGAPVLDLSGSVERSFTIWNDGEGTLGYALSVVEGSRFFSVSPAQGSSTGPGDAQRHTVRLDAAGLELGEIVTGRIQILAPQADDSPRYIELVARLSLAPPTGLVASDGAYPDMVAVRWNAAPGAHYYRLYRSDSETGAAHPLGGWGAATSYADTQAELDVVYYYRVRSSLDAFGAEASALSAPDAGWRGVGAPPTGPSIGADKALVYFNPDSTSEVFGVWNAGLGELGYTVSVVEGGSRFSVSPAEGVSAGFSDSGVHTVVLDREGMEYGASARGKIEIAAAGAEGSPRYVDLLARHELDRPTGLSASDGVHADEVRVTWYPVAGALFYRLFRSASADGGEAALTGWRSEIAFDDRAVEPETLYHYRVRAAVDADGTGETEPSAPDVGWSYDPTPLAAPATVEASDGGYVDGVRVACEGVTGARFYRFYRAIAADEPPAPLGNWQEEPLFHDASAAAGTFYYYWVRAAADADGARASEYVGSDSGWLPRESDLRDYKITAKRCVIEIEEGARLVVRDSAGKATIKIKRLKKPTAGSPEKAGVRYLRCAVLAEIRSDVSLKKIWTEAPVGKVAVQGLLGSLTAKGCRVTAIEADEVGAVKMTDSRGFHTMHPPYAFTSIEAPNGYGPMRVSLQGVALRRLRTLQWVKRIVLAAKKEKDASTGETRVLPSGAGRVGSEALADTRGEYSLRATALGALSAKGCSVAPDLVESHQKIARISVKRKALGGALMGGFLGVESEPTAMRILAPEIGNLYGEAGVAGVFVAGFRETGEPAYTGSIRAIGARKGVGTLAGEAHVAPGAKAIRFKPDQGAITVYTQAPRP